MKRLYNPLIFLLTFLVFTMSCGKFIGNLRRDLDDSESPLMSSDSEDPEPPSPTQGGRWSERGFLGSEEPGSGRYSNLNHYDRSPANADKESSVVQRPWMSSQEAEENRRDLYRNTRGIQPESSFVSSANVANLEPETKRLYKHDKRATRDDFIDQSQEEGSLWASNGQTNYYFTKNKVRSPGDIVTLVVENDLYRDIGIEVKRTLSPKEKAKEISIIQDQYRAKFLADLEASQKDSISTSAAAPGPAASQAAPGNTPVAVPTPAVLPSPSPMPSPSPLTPEEINRRMPKAAISDVDIYPSLELKPGETMMGEIIERYPNGNFKVRTVKRIAYKKGPPRIVSVIGIVRASDINDETDVINSGKLYEYRVEVAH